MRLSALIHGLLIFAATLGLAVFGTAAIMLRGQSAYAPSNPVSVPYFLTLFFLATLILLAALKVTKRGEVFEVLFTVAMLSGAWFLADVFLPGGAALVAGSAVILIRYAWKRVGWVNFSMVLGIAGVAVSVGSSLSANGAVIVLMILAFYDIVAVYATKHMVRLFRDLTSRGAIFAFLLTPLDPRNLLKPAKDAAVDGKTMFLGTGDVALPAILAASAARIHPVHGAAVTLGAMSGFFLMYVLFFRQGRRAPMPALPPIALGSILGYLLSQLLA